jgi:anaerobic selenocysteine-containing dehydrogenase
MIVVDPRLTVTASKADAWLAIRSGTDMALGLGIIHYLFEHKLADLDFCEQWVEGWRAWRDYIQQKQYTPEWAASVTDLQAQQIIDLANAIAGADGCMIFLSRGINQHTNALQTNRVFMFLAAITGNWGRKSGGFFNFSSELDWQAPAIPAHRRPSHRAAIGRSPVDWLDAMNTTATPYPVRALIAGNNPLGQWPDQSKVRKAIQSLDLLVHMELFKNATSLYADYVLPMASGIEKGGTTRFAEDRRIVWNDRFIDPPGEAKSDHWFWIELGKRFGFDDILKPEYANPRTLWDEVLVPATPDITGVTTERLTALPNRSMRIPLRENPADELDPLYITQRAEINPNSDEVYPTPSGKLEFWTDVLEQKFAELGFSALPEFYSEKYQLVDLPYLQISEQTKISPFFENDVLVHPASIKYPETSRTENLPPESVYDTELISGRPPAPHFHSWTHYFWQAQEMWPELYCQIHPEKAEKHDIKDGDQVIIETSNGAIKARAWLYCGIRPSSVFIPIGWDEQQPYHPAATVNHLTGSALDPISQQANLKSHLCRVSKAGPESTIG